MHIELKLHQVQSDSLLLAYVERRLNFLLGRFRPRIGRVTVRIGGNPTMRPDETLCRMTVELQPFGPITSEAVDADAYTAIERCANRLARRCDTKYARFRALRTGRASIRVPDSLPKAG